MSGHEFSQNGLNLLNFAYSKLSLFKVIFLSMLYNKKKDIFKTDTYM